MAPAARILTVANRKGGTGKTTTAVNLGAEFAARGYRILVVDLDPQGHSGLGFGLFAKAGEPTAHAALKARLASYETAIRVTDIANIHLVPADQDFDGNIRLSDPWCIAQAIAPLKTSFDVILIDTPPASAGLLVCAMMASDGVIVPTNLEYLALDGVRQFARSYHRAVVSFHAGLLGLAILPTRVDFRSNVQKDVFLHLIRSFGRDQILTGIRTDTKVSEAFGRKMPLLKHDNRAKAAADYADAASKIVSRFECRKLQDKSVYFT